MSAGSAGSAGSAVVDIRALPVSERVSVLEELAKTRTGFGQPAAARQRLLEDRVAAGGIRFFVPQAQQVPFLKFTKSGCLVIGGNQCLAKGTIVASPYGTRSGIRTICPGIPIEEVRPGDWVYGWDSDKRTSPPVRVLAVYNNGPRTVRRWIFEAGVEVTATSDHKFLSIDYCPTNLCDSPKLRMLGEIQEGWGRAYRYGGDIPWMQESCPPAPLVKLVSVEDAGTQETYDLLVDHASHIFRLENGLYSANSGKTIGGVAEAVWRMLGTHPYKRTHDPPIKVWFCSQSLPSRVKPKPDGSLETHRQLEALRQLIPKDALRNSSWADSYSAAEESFTLRNGSMGQFKGYDQGPLKFESDIVTFVLLDEEPDDETMFTSIQMRLLRYEGQWMMTATPVLSLLGRGWIEKGLWEKRNEPDCEFEVHQLFTTDNPYLPVDHVERTFGTLSEQEKAVRMRGAFARVGGVVLSEYDPSYHLYDGPLPPAYWRHYLIVDPGGRSPTAGLFAAADPKGVLWLYGEHYVKEQLPRYHMRCFHAMYRAFGEPKDITVQFDPAVRARERTISHGQMDRSALDEYYEAADEIGAKWFRPSMASNADVFAWRVKRFLAMGKLFVYRHLKWWQWEAEKWTYERQAQGIRAREKPVPERPVDRDDHLMACLVGDTVVLSKEGRIEIKLLRPGDFVWTRLGLRRVTATFQRLANDVYCLRWGDVPKGDYLEITGNHPVFSGGVMIPVSDLKTGDPLLAADSRAVRVVQASKQMWAEHAVYNLEVEEAHEYYANGILVSNCTRYLCNDRPFPLDDEIPVKTKLEEHWDKMAALERGGGRDEEDV